MSKTKLNNNYSLLINLKRKVYIFFFYFCPIKIVEYKDFSVERWQLKELKVNWKFQELIQHENSEEEILYKGYCKLILGTFFFDWNFDVAYCLSDEIRFRSQRTDKVKYNIIILCMFDLFLVWTFLYRISFIGWGSNKSIPIFDIKIWYRHLIMLKSLLQSLRMSVCNSSVSVVKKVFLGICSWSKFIKIIHFI